MILERETYKERESIKCYVQCLGQRFLQEVEEAARRVTKRNQRVIFSSLAHIYEVCMNAQDCSKLADTSDLILVYFDI